METLPAVALIGARAPAQSRLAVDLSRGLAARGVHHALFRIAQHPLEAYGHGRGTGPLRIFALQGPFIQQDLDYACRQIDERCLPLLVDLAPLPANALAQVLDHCTHAIMLVDAESEDAPVRLTHIRPDLLLLAEHPMASEVLPPAGERSSDQGRSPGHAELLDRLHAVMNYAPEELRSLHLRLAPDDIEICVELDRLRHAIAPAHRQWRPEDLASALEYLPFGVPLALYGDVPPWLYAAIAAHLRDTRLAAFDPTAGWIEVPTLSLTPAIPRALLRTEVHDEGDVQALHVGLQPWGLDYRALHRITAPRFDPTRGVLIEGYGLPAWLWMALARAYSRARWLAVHDPETMQAPIVIFSRDPAAALGSRPPTSPLSEPHRPSGPSPAGRSHRSDGADDRLRSAAWSSLRRDLHRSRI